MNMTDDKRKSSTSDGPESSASYQLALEGRGIKLERDVSEDVARQIIDIVMGGALARATAEPATTNTGSGGRLTDVERGPRGQSLREFLNEVEASRNLDKIVAIGAYLQNERGYDTFTPAQIKSEFRNAREAVPGNFPRDVRSAVAAGWLASSPEDPKALYVTDSGHRAIEARFAPEVRRRARSQQPVRRRRSRESRANT
jgi:hypothetical protein